MVVVISRGDPRHTVLVICKNEWTLQSEEGFMGRPLESYGTTTVSDKWSMLQMGQVRHVLLTPPQYGYLHCHH